MVAICPRKYQRPRNRGRGGCGRPGFVAPKQQLQYTIYRVLSSTAVQQYSSTAETAVQQLFDTTHAERWSADFLNGNSSLVEHLCFSLVRDGQIMQFLELQL